MDKETHLKELQRTHPDYVVYVPETSDGMDAQNQHFLVTPTNKGTFLAFWTQAHREAFHNQHMVMSRSEDRGKTWSVPIEIDGPAPDDPQGTGLASWGFPFVIPETGRIYCFYNKNIGIQDVRTADTGVLRFRYSDDDGLTWSDKTFDLPIRRSAFSNPDPSVPDTWIVYQSPIALSDGSVLVGFTRHASAAVDVHDDSKADFLRGTELWFLRFENLITEPDPEKLVVTTWPEGDQGVRVEDPATGGKSLCSEPAFQVLSDGRLFCVMRTSLGRIYFTISSDFGKSWSEARELCYEPGGQPLVNPIVSCPLYRLSDGRYFLIFYNNEGRSNGGFGPADWKRNRTPVYFSIGHEVDDPVQPMRFDHPVYLFGSDGVKLTVNENTDVATYPSFFEYDGTAYFWYPDRKHFLLGKRFNEILGMNKD